MFVVEMCFFFSSRRRHTRYWRDWSSDVCSSDLTATEAVRLLTCVQGQDLPGALTSVALRTAQRTRAGVAAALDAGEVVRSWPMRSTLHLVPAEDLHWLLELCGPRVLAGAARRRAVLGLTEADTERARELVTA